MLFSKKNNNCKIAKLEAELKRVNESLAESEVKRIQMDRKHTESATELLSILTQERSRNAIIAMERDTNIAELKEKYEEKMVTARAEANEAARSEVKKELSDLKSQNATLTKTNGEISGKYQGALLNIKTLEGQITDLQTMNKLLASKLPEVTATVKTVGDTNVSVNR